MRVLVVEDDADISALVSFWLGEEAETRVRHNAAEITPDDLSWCEAVLTDHLMPGVKGCEVLAMVKELRPEVRRVLWTAIAEFQECEAADAILYKPASRDAMWAALNGE